MENVLKCYEIVKTDFVRGQNCSLYDVNGKRYVDLESGIWCTALGHNHPRINQAIKMQLDRIIHLGTRYPNALVEETAQAVLEITGIEQGKCTFLCSGSEAVEFGVQVIRRISGKPLLLTFQNSFLGSYGSAGGKDPAEWHLFDWSTCNETDPSAGLEQIPFERIGGFVFEPGGSGISFIHFPPKPLVKEIVRRIRQAGGLLLVNEVTTGMGRTGKWFGFQHYDLEPDIIAIGKGLGNGYPVSAVAMQQNIAKRLEESGFRYAQSHQNDPLGCAVASEVTAVFGEENWVEIGEATGRFFLEGLKQLEQKFDVVKEARGRGMLLGLELNPHERISAESVYWELLEHGFLVGYYPAANLLRFDPSLTIEKEDVLHLLECLEDILSGTE